MTIVEIVFNGCSITVEGTYTEGTPATYDHPGDEPEYDVEKIIWKDNDVTELFENLGVSFSAIGNTAVDKINDW